MATPYMKLTLPIPTQTLGPQWALEVNQAIEIIDEHDHSSDKGRRVRTAGLNIDQSLSFNNNLALSVGGSQYLDRTAPLDGPANSNSLYVVNGELHFTNGSGISIKLTSGGSITPTPTTLETIRTDFISSDLVISNLDPFVTLRINTNAAREITLPLAASVAAGRIYLFKDISGFADANHITIKPSNLDTIEGLTELIMKSKRECVWLQSDGINSWNIL